MSRKTFTRVAVSCLAILGVISASADGQVRARTRTRQRGGAAPAKLNVVTTLPDFASLARMIAEDRIEVQSIVHSVQNPHQIRPKPSFVTMVRDADLLIATGLDLEMWLPTVVDKSGNTKVRSGEMGYVAVSHGMELIEIPEVVSQSEGDVHIFGNPHFTCSPINAKAIARNITTGLIKNDPDGKEFYEANLKKVRDEIDRRLFGEELVKLIGGDALCRLADQDKLIDFLKANEYQGKPLIESLGGWMGKMLPLRGKPVVVYHKNWSYLIRLFGLKEMGTIELKPGIPPSPRHVTELVTMMKEQNIKIIIAANYFDKRKVETVAERTGAKALISPLFVGGVPGTEDYFGLVDYWTDTLVRVAQEVGV
jgi:zinc/manganese transport system substrate-binding protein